MLSRGAGWSITHFIAVPDQGQGIGAGWIELKYEGTDRLLLRKDAIKNEVETAHMVGLIKTRRDTVKAKRLNDL